MQFQTHAGTPAQQHATVLGSCHVVDPLLISLQFSLSLLGLGIVFNFSDSDSYSGPKRFLIPIL